MMVYEKQEHFDKGISSFRVQCTCTIYVNHDHSVQTKLIDTNRFSYCNLTHKHYYITLYLSKAWWVWS